MINVLIEPIAEDEYWVETFLSSRYYISNYGRVYSKKNEKILKPTSDGRYDVVSLYLKDEANKSFRVKIKVHKIVAGTFLTKIKDNYVVDHIDRNKQNNKLSNLRYVSISDNNKNRPVKGSLFITKHKTYRVKYIKLSGEKIDCTFKTEEMARNFLNELCEKYKR